MQWFTPDQLDVALLPRSIKRELITNYLMADVYGSFNRFFDERTQEDVDLLYDMSFGFLPRQFEPLDDDKIIYEENQEVAEMYFIMEGFIGIGFSHLQHQVTGRNYILSKKQKGIQLICDHYIVNKKRSQFIYIAMDTTRGFALTSKFLHNQLFPKYRDFETKVKSRCYGYYKKWIFKPVKAHSISYAQQKNRKNWTFRQMDLKYMHQQDVVIPSVQQFQLLQSMGKEEVQKIVDKLKIERR